MTHHTDTNFKYVFFLKHPVQRLVRAAMGFEGVDGLDKVV